MSRPVQSPPAERLQTLLVRTSRTFALSIPRLPEPSRGRVTVAYLLFRIADTLEDATRWSPARRADELERLGRALGCGDVGAAAGRLAREWATDPPLDREAYLELLDETPLVVEALEALDVEAAGPIRRHTCRTIERMAGFLRRDEPVGLDDLDGLRAYCYAVAGIVGEMLTELFVLQSPSLERESAYLGRRAALFGEALQLVNILRDSADDASEGRSFVPGTTGRGPVFALARRDLDAACEYVLRLQSAGAERGIVEFTALPVLLAARTLELVERDGPGAKLTRPQVASIVAKLALDLTRGRGVVPAPDAP